MARKMDNRLVFKNLPVREKVAQIIAAVLLLNSALAMLINIIVTGGNPFYFIRYEIVCFPVC